MQTKVLGLLSLLACTHYATAAVITLYEVVAPSPTGADAPPPVSWETAGTDIISKIGAGEAGMTLYQNINIESLRVGHFTNDVVTFVSTPTTRTVTFQAGASRLRVAHATATETPPPVLLSNGFDCKLDQEKKEGSCDYEWVIQTPVITTNADGATVTSRAYSTGTTTYTGPLRAFATVSVYSSAQGQQSALQGWMVAGVTVLSTVMVLLA